MSIARIVSGAAANGLLIMVASACNQESTGVRASAAIGQQVGLRQLQQSMRQEFTFQIGQTSAMEYDLELLTGLRPPPDLADQLARLAVLREVEASALPGSFSWIAQGKVTEVRNQGACGSCWAFGTIGPMESQRLIDGGSKEDLSEQELLDCYVKGDCSGGWWAFDHAGGIERELHYPYEAQDIKCRHSNDRPHFTVGNWGYVSSTPSPSTNELKAAIQLRGPIAAAFYATPRFQAYKSGVFNELPGWRGTVNHALVLVGWDDGRGAFQAKNSWGDGWGEKGFCWVAFDCNGIGYGSAWVDMK